MRKENTIEEGRTSLIKGEEQIYSLEENSSSGKNPKLFVSISYPSDVDEEETTSLYSDPSCTNLIQELKHESSYNNIFILDSKDSNKIYLKSKYSKDFLFYYKYCTEEDINQVKETKSKMKVKMKEDNGKGVVKIEFDSPYDEGKENKKDFNIKYSIYVTEGEKKNYKIFTEKNCSETKIVEGNKTKYEVEVKINTKEKGHYVYVVAEPKDAKVSLRPRIIYTGCKIPKFDGESTSDKIINGILIVLIIITLIYKIIKKRKKYLEQQAGGKIPEKNPLA